MTRQIWVRVGALGQIRPLVVSDSTDYPRLTRVICQTKRGLEIGETLAPIEKPTGEPEGTVMRALRPDDDAHLARLRLRSDAAFRSCRQWMQQSRMSAVLIDVELLFDGRSMNLYFADQIPARVELLRQQLARTYQAIVRFHAIESEPSADSSGRAVDCSGGG
ncbi:MAG: PSP1 domain-containing protein, partial [Planctomycetes bacterium]|nr:PSP1 domain-containing protein [Planctomycetota bacterium]